MELGNEPESAVGTTWEGSKHLVSKISTFPLEPIKFTETHELSTNPIKPKSGGLSEGGECREGLGGGEKMQALE